MGHDDLEPAALPRLIEAFGGTKVQHPPPHIYKKITFPNNTESNAHFCLQIIDVAAGGWHSVALGASGEIYTWGWNIAGQLGVPNLEEVETTFPDGRVQKEYKRLPQIFTRPMIIPLPKEKVTNQAGIANGTAGILNGTDPFDQHNIVKVSAGARHTIVTTDKGLFLGSGWNIYGQLIVEEREFSDFRELPVDRDGYTNINLICGDWCTVMLADKI